MRLSLETISRLWSAVFSRVKRIPCDDPELTSETWCIRQPCMEFRVASKRITISQPFSTFWVYFLSVLTIYTGVYFFQIQHGETSRLYWGICLLLWGIGALFAGTSYQAFGYEIKCKGRKVCAWTSWWELVYLMFQQISLNTLLVAVAYSCTSDVFQKVLLGYAVLNSVVYIVIVFIGGIVPVKSLITFEFMVWFSAPILFLCLLLNTCRFFIYKDIMDLALLGTWIFLLFTMIAYWTYHKKGISKKLWEKSIWFSENDVLHILLILWMIYIMAVVADCVKDYPILSS